MDISEWVPAPLRAIGPANLAYWQWIAIGVAIPLAVIVGRIAAFAIAWAARRLARKTEATLDDELVEAYAGPLRLLGTIIVLRALIPIIGFPDRVHRIGVGIVLAGLALVVVWAILRTIDVAIRRATAAAWAVRRPSSRALLSLLARAGKVVVVVIAAISVLGSLGLPVSSLLAGLGIGGIALAFGAQKTVENLFGAVAIGVDQPLREGDYVRIEDNVLGTVEAVGLRSSRIRTPDRTVITLPNGRLADMRIETFAVRDRCRLSAKLGLVYGTTGAQLRSIITAIDRVLREHPNVWPDDVAVSFVGFGESSLDVEVIATFQTSDWALFRGYRQDLFLAMMDIVAREGSDFAFPTRTLHVVGERSALKA